MCMRMHMHMHTHMHVHITCRIDTAGNRVTSPNRRSSLENEEDEPDWLKHAASIFNSHDSAKGDVAVLDDDPNPNPNPN